MIFVACSPLHRHTVPSLTHTHTCTCSRTAQLPLPLQISNIYEFQDAEEYGCTAPALPAVKFCNNLSMYDCKAAGFHSREAHVRIGSDVAAPPLPPASPLAPSKSVGGSSSPASPLSPGAGAPNLLTDQDMPVALTATLLLGNELGRCVLPEALFRVRRYTIPNP